MRAGRAELPEKANEGVHRDCNFRRNARRLVKRLSEHSFVAGRKLPTLFQSAVSGSGTGPDPDYNFLALSDCRVATVNED